MSVPTHEATSRDVEARAVLRALRSARLHKVLPALVTVGCGAILAGRPLSPLTAVLCSLVIVSSTALGMKLNVLTDRDLDHARKPELFERLTRNRRAVGFLVAVETSSFILSAAWLVCLGAGARLVWLLVFAALFTLYSFNFFMPHRGVALRLKLFWWGNAITVMGAYLSLWLVAFAGAPHASALVALAVTCSGAEYALFLCECATDAVEETAHGLETLPALLGRRGTVLAALAIATGFAALWAVWLRGVAAASRLAGVGDYYLTVAVASISWMLLVASRPHRHAKWDRMIDACFWGLRLGLVVIVAFGGRHAVG